MATRSVVYVVQQQQRWDEKTQALVPKFDMTSAEAHGSLEYLLSPTARPFNSESIVADLHKRLQYFTDEDFLLLVGNPCLIGMAVAIASYYNGGKINMLQWSGKESKYFPISTCLFEM